MKVVIQSVNPAFKAYVEQYVSEIESPHYELVGTEGFGGSTYIYDCDEENPWLAVAGLQAAVRRPPLGNIMFCQVKPHGMLTWPPIRDKDKYPKPEGMR